MLSSNKNKYKQETRSCQKTEENIRGDPILSKIADSVSGGTVRGENVAFICVTDNTIILRFDYIFKTKNNEPNWGWSAIDMLKNQANYTLDQIVPYAFMVNQTEMKHHIAILSK